MAPAFLFADVVDFTPPLSARMSPTETVELLNEVFSHFDTIVEKHGLEKIKTIGDCYMAAAGVPRPRPDHAQAIVRAGGPSRCGTTLPKTNSNGHQIKFRIGVNSGPGRRRGDWAQEVYLRLVGRRGQQPPAGWNPTEREASSKSLATRTSWSKTISTANRAARLTSKARVRWRCGGLSRRHEPRISALMSGRTRVHQEGEHKKVATGEVSRDSLGARNFILESERHAMGAILNGLALTKRRAFGSVF